MTTISVIGIDARRCVSLRLLLLLLLFGLSQVLDTEVLGTPLSNNPSRGNQLGSGYIAYIQNYKWHLLFTHLVTSLSSPIHMCALPRAAEMFLLGMQGPYCRD